MIDSFSIAKPQFLILIFAILPAIFFILIKFKKIEKIFADSDEKNQKNFRRLKISVFLRTLFRSLSWIFAILALSEISFGSKNLPSAKSGNNVTFVFDISYSMLASDCPFKLSRLDSAKIYAKALLDKLSESSFSAVLAKGDGFLALPETEDVNSMQNLIENLSPKLVTSAGSSLSKGLECAIESIPETSAKNQLIWIFTDGDETDNLLEKSLEKAARLGISVSILGFGDEKEREILTGDGKTRVKTALRSQKLKEIVRNVNENPSSFSVFRKNSVRYIDSRENGSAWSLLDEVKNLSGQDEKSIGYEIQTVKRHGFFIFLAILFLILSFIVTKKSGKNQIFASNFAFFLLILTFTSCSSEKKQILEGTWAWYSKEYSEATADFLKVISETEETDISHDYAIFDLGATYLSLDETEAALDRISSLNPDRADLNSDLKSAAFYNLGVIYSQKGEFEKAKNFFKKAVVSDSKNTSAKINLELCERKMVQKRGRAGESEISGVSEEKNPNPEMESEIFNLIREQEEKKWRNMNDGAKNSNDVLDY